MDRTQQIAALRRELRSTFPSSHPISAPGAGLHEDASGLPTGLKGLDQLLSGQGLPRGRISELTGAPSSGKTTLAFQIIATATRAGLPVAYIDAARTFYPPSAAAMGIDLDRLLLVQAKDLTAAFKAADILLRGQAFPLVIFDWGTDPPPGPAFLDQGSAIARLNGLCALSKAVMLFLTTPKTAREPIRYYATLRLEVRREEADRQGVTPLKMPPPQDDTPSPVQEATSGSRRLSPLKLVGLPVARSGVHLTVQVIKNKLGPSGRRLEVALRGDEAARLPLHPGIPDPASPAR